jgi:hypothetical protein
MKDFFTTTVDFCKISFEHQVIIDATKPIEEQLHRRVVTFCPYLDKESIDSLKKVIAWNSSLSIEFGWSFNSVDDLQTILKDCRDAVPVPVYNLIRLTSDLRKSWVGFVPFDYEFLKDLCVEDLVYLNNVLIKYQTDVVKFIINHRLYKINLLVSNNNYRFTYFKAMRNDPIALSESFQYYMEGIEDVLGITSSISRDIVEEMIGCHFLYHPDLFFELLQFYILKGQIHE